MILNIDDKDVKKIAILVSVDIVELKDVLPSILEDVITNKAFCQRTMANFFVKTKSDDVDQVVLALLKVLKTKRGAFTKSVATFIKQAGKSVKTSQSTKEAIESFLMTESHRLGNAIVNDSSFINNFPQIRNETALKNLLRQVATKPKSFIGALDAIYNPNTMSPAFKVKRTEKPSCEVLDMIDKERLTLMIVDKTFIGDRLMKAIEWYYPEVLSAAYVIRL